MEEGQYSTHIKRKRNREDSLDYKIVLFTYDMIVQEILSQSYYASMADVIVQEKDGSLSVI